MNQALADIFAWASGALWHEFVVFLRVAAIASLLPAFGEQTVPVRIKITIALVFSFVVASAMPLTTLPITFDTMIMLTLTETISGLLLGLGIRLFILALQTAGSIAAQATSLSQILGGAVTDPIPAMGYIFVLAALAFAAMSGLHVKAVEFMLLSYTILPIGIFLDASAVSEWGTKQVARAFSLAFTLSAPFLILAVLYNFALGAINRAMPQLMVAFVGAPVITAGGLILMLLASPLVLHVWLDALDLFLVNPMRPGN